MSAGDELVVDPDAVAEAARRVSELMSTVSEARLPATDVGATGHARLAERLHHCADAWDPLIADAHDEGDRLVNRLLEAAAEYRSTDASVVSAAESLSPRRGVQG
jgi:hypothetical protein